MKRSVIQQLNELEKEKPGLLKKIGGLYLRGELPSQETCRDIAEAQQKFPDLFRNQATRTKAGIRIKSVRL